MTAAIGCRSVDLRKTLEIRREQKLVKTKHRNKANSHPLRHRQRIPAFANRPSRFPFAEIQKKLPMKQAETIRRLPHWKTVGAAFLR